MRKSPPSRKSRVLLVEDHSVVREGFAEIINRNDDLEVCGAVGSAPKALGAVERLKPDVVVVDLSLQAGSGLDFIKGLHALRPCTPVLVLSMHDEELYAERALRAGALGYVMKREEPDTMLRGIRAVLRGDVFVSRKLRDRLVHSLVGSDAPKSPAGLGKLADREIEVFQLIGEGLTTREISQKLNVSISTVDTYRARIKDKLRLDSTAKLMRMAVAAGGAQP